LTLYIGGSITVDRGYEMDEITWHIARRGGLGVVNLKMIFEQVDVRYKLRYGFQYDATSQH